MAENTKIEWCDHTFNPWIGCTKVSEGCQFCYAEALMDKRYGKVKWGPQGVRMRTSFANWKKPLAWNRKAEAEGQRHRVFCASLADVFEEKPDQPEMDEWRHDLFHRIWDTPHLDWLLLTKRPENVNAHFQRSPLYNDYLQQMGELPPNIWIGTSVENQEQADLRIPHLLNIPAAIRFLSMEPLLGPVNLTGFASPLWGKLPPSAFLHWVIVGGESGPNARPMHPDWARSLRDQCVAAGVPFFFKQWGMYSPASKDTPRYQQRHLFMFTESGAVPMIHTDKKSAGRHLDGRTWDEFPQVKL